MPTQENTYHIKFYGIDYPSWKMNFGLFYEHTKQLVEGYISEGCTTVESSTATAIHKFLFPQHIRKTYFIEGIAEGEVCFCSSTATATLYAYRVSICKMHEDTTEKELFTTGWVIPPNAPITLGWDTVHSIPDSDTGERVFNYRIDCWENEKLDELERIYLKVETDTNTCTASSCSNCILMHSNDSKWTDVWIDIPFRW